MIFDVPDFADKILAWQSKQLAYLTSVLDYRGERRCGPPVCQRANYHIHLICACRRQASLWQKFVKFQCVLQAFLYVLSTRSLDY